MPPKHQRRIPGFDEKIIALFAKGLSTRDIQEILEDLYGVEVSATLISEATAVIDDEVTTWRSRPIDPVWPIVDFDVTSRPMTAKNKRLLSAIGKAPQDEKTLFEQTGEAPRVLADLSYRTRNSWSRERRVIR